METILQNTTLNISQQEIYDKGFEYYTNLGISIQGADAIRTLKEIINIIKIKNYSMELKIKLKMMKLFVLLYKIGVLNDKRCKHFSIYPYLYIWIILFKLVVNCV